MEPMDVDATGDFDKFDDVLEEGEYVEFNRVSRKTVSSPSTIVISENKIQNKADTFITGVDIFNKQAKEQMEEKAKRFGITNEKEKFSLQDIENLYDSFDIVEGSENTKNYRLNVLHMRGVEKMNTKDIFQYFKNYAPASIEWIDDISCNVVWLDKATSARAILGLSKRIVGVKKLNQKSYFDEDNSDDDLVIVNGNQNYKEEKNTVHVNDLRCPLPSGIWRKGQDYLDSRSIFLRFASVSDRKLPFDEKIYLRGILRTSRKRPHRQSKDTLLIPKKESNTNGIAHKNPWGLLSENWGVTDFIEDDYLPKQPLLLPSVESVSNIRERLGYKPLRKRRGIEEIEPDVEISEESESESSSDEENWCKRSKIPRMRMHADDEEEKLQKRKGKIRTMANQNIPLKGNDLRKRLSARRRLPSKSSTVLPSSLSPKYKEDIQVIVTNPKAIRSNFQDLSVTEDEEDDTEDVIGQNNDEEEEGEIVDSDSKVESKDDDDVDDDDIDDYDDDDDDDDENEIEAESESESHSETDNDSSDSTIPEKEVQGPKGSVIKVVSHKPKLASTVSTVWTKKNHCKKKENRNSMERATNDLRHSIGKKKRNDLRSRIGKHIRSRSPLRIELRNDKYSGEKSGSD